MLICLYPCHFNYICVDLFTPIFHWYLIFFCIQYHKKLSNVLAIEGIQPFYCYVFLATNLIQNNQHNIFPIKAKNIDETLQVLIIHQELKTGVKYVMWLNRILWSEHTMLRKLAHKSRYQDSSNLPLYLFCVSWWCLF